MFIYGELYEMKRLGKRAKGGKIYGEIWLFQRENGEESEL